jgi:sodium-dependent dicarboxylate transporter 2/3/5
VAVPLVVMEDPREEAAQVVERIPEGIFGALGIESPKRILIFIACGLVSLAVVLLLRRSPDLTPAARRALFILVFAGALWVTEAIPAYAVGILVIGLQIALLGRPGGVFAETARDWEQFVVVIGHPLVWLFFGGFVLAAGMARTGLDRQLASWVLTRFGDRPPALLLGIMAITFTLSMFMSNTATTAMILAMIAPLVASLDEDDPFVPGLLLGVAVAANLGGMGSLIGTPPNAIAEGARSEAKPSEARHEV